MEEKLRRLEDVTEQNSTQISDLTVQVTRLVLAAETGMNTHAACRDELNTRIGKVEGFQQEAASKSHSRVWEILVVVVGTMVTGMTGWMLWMMATMVDALRGVK